ncbi:hypothetical protein Y1Q_0024521 [Alligator mississippiensis]|uniref:Uncharacterized protein n=1 Tax=Alligator mississippiensis TaxID=8496 RepID=A0A151NBP4_ALLMI|nr:hypothetical protein Y1Q_0024521 [Alligator mississippiensis]
MICSSSAPSVNSTEESSVGRQNLSLLEDLTVLFHTLLQNESFCLRKTQTLQLGKIALYHVLKLKRRPLENFLLCRILLGLKEVLSEDFLKMKKDI